MVIIPTPFAVVLSFYPLASPFILKIGTRKWPNRNLSTPFTEVEIAFTVHLQTLRRGRRKGEKTVQRWGFVEIAAVIHHESITRWWRRLLSTLSQTGKQQRQQQSGYWIGSSQPFTFWLDRLVMDWNERKASSCVASVGLNKTKQRTVHSSVHIY